jgi:hypothetical protein
MKANPVSQTSLTKMSRCHHQTVSKFLRGIPIRSDAERRLRLTLEKIGAVDTADLTEDESKRQ